MYINENDTRFQKCLKMTREEYDKYMCETYPILFKDRHRSMQETCMYWGFDINRGWYPILDKICSKVQEIIDQTNIQVVFDQIKEKFGTARFYFHTDTSKCKLNEQTQIIWCDIINDIISDGENATNHVCAECGKYHSEPKPTTGFWIHDTCNQCFLKIRPKNKEQLEKSQKIDEIKDKLGWILVRCTDEEEKSLEKLINDVNDRIEDDSNKN